MFLSYGGGYVRKDTGRENQLIHRLFIYILQFSLIISTFNIIGNIMYGFPIIVNVKWIAFIIVTSFTYFFTKNRIVIMWKFFYFLFLIYAMLPFGFIDSGGSNNNTIGYLFIVVICVTFFFLGWQRYFLIVSTVLIFNVLLVVEQKFPEIIKVYSEESQTLDRMVQISLLLIISFLFLKNFSDTYSRDKKKLDNIVHIDSLTRLNNRRSFDEILMNEVKNENASFDYLVFIDIDNFKEINDTLGHHQGDEMIKSTAVLLNSVFSGTHIVARWGGDEFSVLFKGKEDDLTLLLDKFIKNNEVPVSCGFTSIVRNTSVETLLKQADHALYESKNNGRNQWCKYIKETL